jgi:hypothetical protein
MTTGIPFPSNVKAYKEIPVVTTVEDERDVSIIFVVDIS